MIWIVLSCKEPEQKEILVKQEPLQAQIRLLSRREYRNTVMDLIGLEVPFGSSCSSDGDCDIANESCSFGQCIVDDCSKTTFIYEGSAGDEVFVVGSFSNWSTDPNWGAWQMSWSEDANLHYIKGDILPQHITEDYRYQFSVNGTLITDPNNPNITEHDGQNYSTMHVGCSTNGRYLTDPTDGFPAESRGSGFHFDHQASRGVVTTGHLDRYIRSADWISEAADLEFLEPCTVENPDSETCIDLFISSIGKRLFRRSLRSDETERYASVYAEHAQSSSSSQAYREVLFTMLCSPYFLYRTELGEENGTALKLTNHEIASAMSYFLWGSAPDDLLLEAAEQGKLSKKKQRQEQAQRMLDSYKAQRHVKDLLIYWLGAQGLRNTTKDLQIYPEYTADLALALERELEILAIELFLQDNGTYEQLFSRKNSYVNQRTAVLYGIDNVFGPQFQLKNVPKPRRGGVLGTGGWLSAHSPEHQSSPIRRGVAVRERMLCHELPEPPAIAGVTPQPDENTTNQQRFEAHTTNPQCANCHKYIDGIGLPLERFDGDGSYRKRENSILISTEGELWDIDYMGQDKCDYFSGLPELADLLAYSNQGPNCFVRQMYRSSAGEVETPAQEQLIRDLTNDFIQNGGSIRDLLINIVADPSFITRKPIP
ncbi:MAG: hypothetical protein CMK59_04755 [Proteobacteria bacterium]|nr:hypothetical protein [Pseudomonadota bacterium]